MRFYSLSSSNLSSVGLYLGAFALRCLVVGVARLGGGSPIFSRAAAFTAADALNGLSLRGFDGILLLPCSPNLTSMWFVSLRVVWRIGNVVTCCADFGP